MVIIGTVIILFILYSMNSTMKNILAVQERQNNINRELKQRIENRDNFMCKVQEELKNHIKEEDKIYELISNFGKEE